MGLPADTQNAAAHFPEEGRTFRATHVLTVALGLDIATGDCGDGRSHGCQHSAAAYASRAPSKGCGHDSWDPCWSAISTLAGHVCRQRVTTGGPSEQFSLQCSSMP